MLFPLRCQAVECNRKMHKLAMIDNCTQVLLPTQALSFAVARSGNRNSHPSQPKLRADTHVEWDDPSGTSTNCQPPH